MKKKISQLVIVPLVVTGKGVVRYLPQFVEGKGKYICMPVTWVDVVNRVRHEEYCHLKTFFLLNDLIESHQIKIMNTVLNFNFLSVWSRTKD